MTDDPFAPSKPPGASHPQSTIIKPAPGGRGPSIPGSEPPPGFGPLQPEPEPQANRSLGLGASGFGEASLGRVDTTGVNPILDAATQLLVLAGQLRNSSSYADMDGLFRQLCQEVRAFEVQLNRDNTAPEAVSIARYTLCGFLDEAILNTPWGSDSGWGSRTLLAEFHNEVDAGEKVFAILDRIKPDPGRYLHLLELIYVCLSLGFQGKYRRQDRGLDDLELLRAEISSIISRQRGPVDPELSPQWQGANALRPKFTRFVPLWVVAASLGLILLLAFGGMLRWLYSDSDPVMREVSEMGRFLDPVVAKRVDLAPPKREPSLVEQLQPSISQGVLEAGGHDNVVVLRDLFPSGSVAVDEAAPALQAVVQALGQLRGNVRITGHTDNVPIRTIRFPSNWELSEARALAVRQALQRQGIPGRRMIAEARADTEPACSACDQSKRLEQARNRRVEIELLAGAKRQ